MDAQKTGRLISSLRKNLGLTQQDVAEKLGITDKTVSKWERGNGYPDITIIPELADLFHVTVDEILRGELASEEPLDSYLKSKNCIEHLLKMKYLLIYCLLFTSIGCSIVAIVLLFTLGQTLPWIPTRSIVSTIFCAVGVISAIMAFINIQILLTSIRPAFWPNIERFCRSAIWYMQLVLFFIIYPTIINSNLFWAIRPSMLSILAIIISLLCSLLSKRLFIKVFDLKNICQAN